MTLKISGNLVIVVVVASNYNLCVVRCKRARLLELVVNGFACILKTCTYIPKVHKGRALNAIETAT